jgi:hypothetical protein
VRFARSGNLCRLIFGVSRPVRDGLPTRIFKILRFYRHKVKEMRSRGSRFDGDNENVDAALTITAGVTRG